jgi:hypothetical protein
MADEQKTCISCGMPLRAQSDYASGDIRKAYCHHCAREDGSMKSYDEVLAGMSAFLVRTQGMDEQVGRKMAATVLAKLPAWRQLPQS